MESPLGSGAPRLSPVVGVSAPASPRPWRGREALLWASLALVTLALIELSLAVAERASERVSGVLRGVSPMLDDARLGRRGNPATADNDARGWRNASALTHVDVLALGDSQTYGEDVPREQAWPQLLAQREGRSVYNMAFPGYGPIEYERVLEEGLALRPRVVLVGLYSGNDLADDYVAAYMQGRAAELTVADAAQRARFSELDAGGPVFERWQETLAARTRPPRVTDPLRRLWRASSTGNLLRVAWRATKRGWSGGDASRADAEKAWRKATERAARVDAALLWPFRAGELATVFTPAARLAVIDIGDPRIAEGLRIALAALERMSARCAGRCRLAVVIIPTKELVFAEEVARSGVAAPPSYAALIEREAALWRAVAEGLAQRGIPYADALPRLRASVARGETAYLTDSNGHPAPRGQEQIFETASALLRSLEDESIPAARSR